jgi:hypothetical protein
MIIGAEREDMSVNTTNPGSVLYLDISQPHASANGNHMGKCHNPSCRFLKFFRIFLVHIILLFWLLCETAWLFHHMSTYNANLYICIYFLDCCVISGCLVEKPSRSLNSVRYTKV